MGRGKVIHPEIGDATPGSLLRDTTFTVKIAALFR
jgi:hypothetical protein